MHPSTQQLHARSGKQTPELVQVAQTERVDPEWLRERVAAGRAVIPANPAHKGLRPMGIGRGLDVKVNANIGNSSLSSGMPGELDKLETALRAGADTVMDLSTGPEVEAIRAALLARCAVPLGTVPIYEAVDRAGDAESIDGDLLLGVIEAQAKQGVDYMTLHAGLLRSHLPAAGRRAAGIVSRGGAILARWMTVHERENPLYDRFDDVLAICRDHDVTVSLGDGLRPGCLADASDEAQFAELEALGDLIRRCREAGVQAMVEGPGHVPLDQVEHNMRIERESCDDAPFYILGPVVIDCAPGYDHLVGAIGGALGGFHGAAMLCYVTPKEHLGLPNAQDVHDGVIAFRIAAHAANVALGRPGARDRDDAITRARVAFDWEGQFRHALDPGRARAVRREALQEREGTARPPDGAETEGAEEEMDHCTMCGPQFCSLRISRDLFHPTRPPTDAEPQEPRR